MRSVRFLAWIFGGIFAFGCGLIGFAMTEPYLTYMSELNKFALLYRFLFIAFGAIVGFVIGMLLFHRIAEVGRNLRRIPVGDKIAAILGTLLSLVPAVMLGNFIVRLPLEHTVVFAIILLESVLFIWLFNVIALSMKDEMKYMIPGGGQPVEGQEVAANAGGTPKLLDTNVIIDGRIYDICRSGFLEGPLILPGFVLEELHHISDSADALRRNRGRRGLDILHQMQTELENQLRIVERYKVTFATGDEVDIKLVKLAKAMSADIVTNDFNLNKVAKIHGVRVLNINELANAVKPVVLPGEELHVTIVREGKEYNQGVGYLDDGTMVVVENGKKMLGDSVAVAVSSVLQTVAGKMIFAELKYEGSQEESNEHNNYYSSRGGRHKTV